MKKITLAITLVILCAGASLAQRETTSVAGEADSNTSVGKNAGAVSLQAGTRLTAQLQQTLDAKKLKEGDQVVLKTTEAIKAEGRTIVNKGARLIGRVTEVRQKTKESGESSMSLVFDRLENGSLEVPISAAIIAITLPKHDNLDGDFGSDVSGQSSTSSSRRQTTSGPLGGGLGTVLSTTDAAARRTGSVVGGATNVAGGTVNDVIHTGGGIRLSQSADASAEGSTTLSLTGNNLHLEKGTSFRLVLTEAASVNKQ